MLHYKVLWIGYKWDAYCQTGVEPCMSLASANGLAAQRASLHSNTIVAIHKTVHGNQNAATMLLFRMRFNICSKILKIKMSGRS